MNESLVSIPARGDLPAAQLNVKRAGSGNALLLVHGFPLNSEMWRNQFALAERFDLIVPDLRGFGKSSPLVEGWKVADFADDLASLITELQLESVILCGLSLGGYIGFEFLDRHCQLARRFVMCNSRAAADDLVTSRGRRQMAERVKNQGPEFLQIEMAPKLLASVNIDRPLSPSLPELFAGIKADSVAITQLAMANRRDFRDQLGEIKVPVSLVAGDDDRITPAAEMQQIAERIPESEFDVVPSAGHLTPIENATRFNQILLRLS